uniref:high mobility group protein B1-like n=1 Tax=Halichoerus grypus TaxID=9711 RepID=UPI0016597D84|nr:high mobility group protein B1-like [Halichoerus grypus]
MSAKEKENLKTWQRRTRPVMKEKRKLISPLKGKQKRSSRIPMHPRGLLRPFSCFVLSIAQKSKENREHPGLSIGDVAKKLGEMWNNTAADDKQPYEKKAVKLKEKYEKDIAAYRAKGKPDAAKKGVVKAEKSKKKKEEEKDEEDEEDEEEEDEEDEEEDNDE